MSAPAPVAEAGAAGKKVAKKSAYPGVYWVKEKRKWRGQVSDRSEHHESTGRAKERRTTLFDDEEECNEATKAKRAEVEADVAKKLHEMAQEMDHTRDLPPCPPNAADAKEKTTYYGEARYKAEGEERKEFRPERYVRVSNGKQGFAFNAGCRHGVGAEHACGQVALNGHYCIIHGGGSRLGEPSPSKCSFCNATRVEDKRLLCNGGNGLCRPCEDHKKREAAENGHEGPPPSKRWEEVFFEMVLPLVTYANGTPFPPDQRDMRKGGGLGTSKAVKRRRECDTTSNRFPDGLWVRRDEEARALLVIDAEADEDSHTRCTPTCESGKIDDSFQAVQKALAFEGAASTSRVGRADAAMVPFIVVRCNTNAYDGGRVPLKERAAAVGRLMNHYAHMPPEDVAKLQTHAPIVHVLYYHSKEGARNLAHYAEKAAEAGWAYHVHGADGRPL